MKFGKMMTIKGRIAKHKTRRSTTWERVEFSKPIQALYIGRRTVFDGKNSVESDGDSSWTEFTKTKKHNVYLFAINERNNPIYVLPSDVDFQHEQLAGEDNGRNGVDAL